MGITGDVVMGRMWAAADRNNLGRKKEPQGGGRWRKPGHGGSWEKNPVRTVQVCRTSTEGVFAQVARGLGCTLERAYSCLASLCSPSARPPRAKKGLSARLWSYAKFHCSWRARLRGAQSSRFGGCFELLARLQVESKHNLKTGRLSWAIAPNTREWPDLAWLRLATAWALGRASHDHPSKHTPNSYSVTRKEPQGGGRRRKPGDEGSWEKNRYEPVRCAARVRNSYSVTRLL
jgi:hypothetical protein